MTAGMMDSNDDVLHDACGVVGCVAAAPWPNAAVDPAADVIYPALANLQHRYAHPVCTCSVGTCQWQC